MPLLRALSPEHRERLVRAAGPVRRLDTGGVLASQGEPADRLFLLVNGEVVARASTAGGRVLILGRWRAPAALDKAPVLAGRPRPAALIASTPVAYAALPAAAFLAALDEDADARRHVLRLLARSTLDGQALALDSLDPASVRVERWLRANAVDGTVCLSGGQEGLAQSLGVTRVTVARALARLRREGKICVEQSVIRML